MNRYENYKEVNLPWLKEVPSHWGIEKVKFIFDERREKVSDKDYQALSVTKKGIYKQLENVAKTNNGDNRKKVLINDFVINSRSDRKGSSGLSSYEGSVSLINTVLFIKNGEPNFLHYLLKSIPFQEEFYRNGKGIVADLWSTNFESMKNIILPFPTLKEQIQIANYLDWKINEIDKLIAKENEKIKELEELKQSSVFEFVTKGVSNKTFKVSNVNFLTEIPSHWKESSIRKYASFVRGNTSFTKDDLKNKGDFIALQYGRVYQTEIINDEYIHFVDKSFYRSSQVVNENDIVIVSTSETIDDLGHVAFYDRKDIGLIGGEQILVKPQENIYPKYLFYLLKVLNTELKLCATGMKVYRFKINDLKNINIPVPSMNEQRKIVIQIDMKLSKINNQIILIKSLIDKYSVIKQSLIAEVVTGQIDVRDVVIPEYEKFDLEVDVELEEEVEEDA